MEEYTVIEEADAYGISIGKARRFTETEKAGYVKWFAENGMVAIGAWTKLAHINEDDMPNRKIDGAFPGCNNRAWIVTEEEAAAYIALNERRGAEKAAKEKASRIADLKEIIANCEGQLKNGRGLWTGLPRREEARRRMKAYNDGVNEGGYGFVPHIYSREEYEAAKKDLMKLMEGGNG